MSPMAPLHFQKLRGKHDFYLKMQCHREKEENTRTRWCVNVNMVSHYNGANKHTLWQRNLVQRTRVVFGPIKLTAQHSDFLYLTFFNTITSYLFYFEKIQNCLPQQIFSSCLLPVNDLLFHIFFRKGILRLIVNHLEAHANFVGVNTRQNNFTNR